MELSKRKKAILLGVVTVVLVFMIGLTFGGFLSKAKESSNLSEYTKYYTNIEIHPGDTLWDLADEYMDTVNYDSKEAYIREVLSINSLNSENHIVAGQFLIMPYYM